LPSHVVNLSSVNGFKNNLDIFGVIKKCTITLCVYDIAGTRNRMRVKLISNCTEV